ncbi:MAG TPA: hypothetical protein DEA44_16740 [Firmicutes bacterium]|nr:hypothetical protein [Bacillota bacterium]
MKQGDIYKSEGGYRIAWVIWAGGPVISSSPWYSTFEEAQAAVERRCAENAHQDAIDKAIYDGDLATLEKIDPKAAAEIKKAF